MNAENKNKGPSFAIVGIVGLALLAVVSATLLFNPPEQNPENPQMTTSLIELQQADEQDGWANVSEETDSEVTVAGVVVSNDNEAVDYYAIAPSAGQEEEDEKQSQEQVEEDQDGDQEKKVDYNTVLSFPITKEKVRNFVIAADKIDQVNQKWDMLISGAESDTMAVEYMTLANEEMTQVMGNISGITVSEYNEIFEYTAKSPEFRNIVNAFKQYYITNPPKDMDQVSNSEISTN